MDDLLKQVALTLEVKDNALNPFSVNDPYNNNQLEGLICRQNDHRYGALVITHVNGEPAFQVIYGAPKIPYPFKTEEQTGERKYNWPKVIEEVRVYEKYDGTNIVAYSYADAEGERFVTFKTRLTAVVRSGDTIDFKKLWDRILDRYPELRCPLEVLDGDYAWSFELFGYQNPILIKYEESINAVHLFKVRQENAQIGVPFGTAIDNKVLHCLHDSTIATMMYDTLREKAEQEHVQEEDGISGTEGFVFYMRTQPYEAGKEVWQMFKCKPADIEKIHWANGSIDKHSIFATARNALENVNIDELTPEFVTELLKEEFTDQQIIKSAIRIKKITTEVVEQRNFVLLVKKEFERLQRLYPELKDNRDKASIMRAFAKMSEFEKGDMRKVYGALRGWGLIIERIEHDG